MVAKAAVKRRVLGVARLINALYGCGPVKFVGTSKALYERHLLFDSGVDLAPDYFNSEEFSHGDLVEALGQTLVAETLTRVLYPDDSRFMGQGLRLMQEYFLGAGSLADAVRRFQRGNSDWRLLPDKVAIQMNDTHRALVVPELMQILVDQGHLGLDQAWQITLNTLAYTNPTLLPEALKKWPVEWFEDMLPKQLEFIYETNYRFLDDVRVVS
ncbi:MAG: glycogen/starch/alpha-glucan phosphorylase [Candidatus Sulfotelmatobacter sp.]